jgi:hypothetical protein
MTPPGIFISYLDTDALKRRFIHPSRCSSSDGSDGSSQSQSHKRVIFMVTSENAPIPQKSNFTDGTDAFLKPLRGGKKFNSECSVKKIFL